MIPKSDIFLVTLVLVIAVVFILGGCVTKSRNDGLGGAMNYAITETIRDGR